MNKSLKYVSQMSLGIIMAASLVSCGGADKPAAENPAPKDLTANPGEVPVPQMENNNPANNPDGLPPKVKTEPVVAGPTTNMTFENNSHDFGSVAAESDNEYFFKFTNTGDIPLVINNASASCGCTVPEWPKEPIAPGEDGQMKVIFKPKPGQVGDQRKTVTVKANIPGGQTQLNIIANVEEK